MSLLTRDRLSKVKLAAVPLLIEVSHSTSAQTVVIMDHCCETFLT